MIQARYVVRSVVKNNGIYKVHMVRADDAALNMYVDCLLAGEYREGQERFIQDSHPVFFGFWTTTRIGLKKHLKVPYKSPVARLIACAIQARPAQASPRRIAMGILLLIVILVLLFGGIPWGGYGPGHFYGTGYGGGGLGLVVVIIIVVLLLRGGI